MKGFEQYFKIQLCFSLMKLHCHHGDRSDSFKCEGTSEAAFIHPDTYTGAKAVSLSAHDVEEVLQSSLLP